MLVWAIASIPVVGALDIAIEIPMFLVQGLSMAAAGVILVTVVPRPDRRRARARGTRDARPAPRPRVPARSPVPHRHDARDVRDHRPHARVHGRDLVHVPRARRRDHREPLGRLRRRAALEPGESRDRRRSCGRFPACDRVAPLGYAAAEFTTPQSRAHAVAGHRHRPRSRGRAAHAARPRRLRERPRRVGGRRRTTRASPSSTTSSSRRRAVRPRRRRTSATAS